MSTQNLTPDQRKNLEQFKAQGVRPAHLERIAARYESYNAAPPAIKGTPTVVSRRAAIQGIENTEQDKQKKKIREMTARPNRRK